MVAINLAAAYSTGDFDDLPRYDLGFFGKSIDDRTTYSINTVSKACANAVFFDYDKEQLKITFKDEQVECHELNRRPEFSEARSVFIDGTSLDVPELALLLKQCLRFKHYTQFDIFYVEPESYTADEKYSPTHEGFHLSARIEGFEGTGIPTISVPVTESLNSRFLFFAGFEENRIANAFETFDINSENSRVIFGVPGFKPGWESTSFRKNIRVLKENGLKGRVGYCSANCASSALGVLKEDLASQRIQAETKIFILPLGTKPNSIGALIFAQESPNINILFDSPDKKPGRTSGVGVKHIYRVLR